MKGTKSVSISITDRDSQDTNRVLSIETTAELLAVSPWTIRKWISDRKIASCKIGSRRVVPASEVSRVISESLVERIG